MSEDDTEKGVIRDSKLIPRMDAVTYDGETWWVENFEGERGVITHVEATRDADEVYNGLGEIDGEENHERPDSG